MREKKELHKIGLLLAGSRSAKRVRAFHSPTTLWANEG
jgi:hypothetical protein